MGSCCSISHGKYNNVEENPIKESQIAQTPKTPKKKVYNNEGNCQIFIPKLIKTIEMAKITTVDVSVHADSFVRRKTGKINADYKFLGSLGKGFAMNFLYLNNIP